MSSGSVCLSIELIQHRGDARPRSDANLDALVQSIEKHGLLSPILVRQIGEGYEVIAGSHRLQAVELLGYREIASTIMHCDDLHAELVMIDENLCRVELSASGRAIQTARRKAIYLELHPETAHGGDRRRDQVAKLATRSFNAETAALSGQSERAVRRDTERGSKITLEVHDLIRGTKLDKGCYLDKIKALPPEEQVLTATGDLAKLQLKAEVPAGSEVNETPIMVPPTSLKAEEPCDAFIRLAGSLGTLRAADVIAGGRGHRRASICQLASQIADQMAAILEGAGR